MTIILDPNQYEWETLTNGETERMLRDIPNSRFFIKTWDKLTFWNWGHLLKDNPRFAVHLYKANLSRSDWVRLSSLNDDAKTFYEKFIK